MVFDEEDAAGVAVDEAVVVGGDEYRGTFGRDAVQEGEDALAGLGVEVAGGLVGKDERGCIEHGAGDYYPLLLAAGQLVGHLVGLVGHAYGVEDGTDAFGTLLTAVHAGGT